MPGQAQRAEANPVIRANAAAAGGALRHARGDEAGYGFGWRDYVRGVTTTFDVGENLAFRDKDRGAASPSSTRSVIAQDRRRLTRSIPTKVARRRKTLPNVIVVAANADGDIVRYYEAGETAVLLRLAARAQLRRRASTTPSARKPHGRLHRQDARRHRHRQHQARHRADSSTSTRRRRRRGSRTARRVAASGADAGRSSHSPARSTHPLMNRAAAARPGARCKRLIDALRLRDAARRRDRRGRRRPRPRSCSG